VKMTGCAACAAAAPEIEKFMQKHPELMVLILDADGPLIGKLGVKIKATPTYIFRMGDSGVTRSGAMKCSEIEKWIRGARL